MIDITLYSFLWVTVVTSIFILLYISIDTIITKNKKLNMRIPMWITLMFTIFISIRMLFPIETLAISQAFISYKILPHIHDIMQKNVFEQQGSLSINLTMVLTIIWLSVSVIMLLLYFLNYYKLHRIVKRIPQSDNQYNKVLNEVRESNNYKFKTKLIQSKAVDLPAECGYLSQTIFINDYDYTEEELKYIFLHELAHFKYKTNWFNLFVNILNIIFWWNPIIYFYRKYINNTIEMYVDFKVTNNMSENDKLDYIKCIFKVYNIITNNNSSFKYIAPLVKSNLNNVLINRFNTIKYKNKINIPMCISILLLLVTYVFISCKFVVQPGWQPPAEELRDMSPSDFTEENSYITMENGEWVLYYNGELHLTGIDINSFKNVQIKK